MEYNDILVFLAVSESGSFSKAAERLGYTAAGVSYIISEIEKEVGMALFLRTHNGVRLNSSGEDLYPEILRIYEANRLLRSKVESRLQGRNVNLHIGSIETVASVWLPDAIVMFREIYPEVEVDVVVGSPHDLNDWIDEGRINYMINERAWTREGLHQVHIANDPYYIITPKNEKLEKGDIEILRDREVIAPYFGNDRTADVILRANNINYKRSFYRVNNTAMFKTIALGRGVALLTELHLKEQEISRYEERFRPNVIKVEPEINRELIAAFNAGSKNSRLVNAITDCVKKAAEMNRSLEGVSNVK